MPRSKELGWTKLKIIELTLQMQESLAKPTEDLTKKLKLVNANFQRLKADISIKRIVNDKLMSKLVKKERQFSANAE